MHHLTLLPSLMRRNIFQRATSNNQLMRVVIDMHIIEVDDNFVAKNARHFLKGDAFCFG
jgi:hypothetical protein